MTNLYVLFLCLICLVHADQNPNVTLPSGPGGILYLSFVFTTVDGALAGGHECDVFDTCDLFFKICVKSVNSRSIIKESLEGEEKLENNNDIEFLVFATVYWRLSPPVTWKTRIHEIGFLPGYAAPSSEMSKEEQGPKKFSVRGTNSYHKSLYCDLYTVTTIEILIGEKKGSLRIQVVIEAWDHDVVSNADYIGRVQGIVLIQNITSLNTPIKLERGKTLYINDFKIEASMRKECNPDYFGQICQYRIKESSSNAIFHQKMIELPDESTETTTPVPETNSQCARAREIIGSEVCLNQGICLDYPDGTSYACYCPPGYNGVRCELLDFCSNITCSGHGKCENAMGTIGTFMCRCNPGWRGVLCDIPEQSACKVAFLNLPKDQLSICLHGGICVENLDGSGFQCQCVNGWIGEMCETHVTQTVAFIAPAVLIPLLVIATLLFTYFHKNFSFKIKKNQRRFAAEVQPYEDTYSGSMYESIAEEFRPYRCRLPEFTKK
ncbi:hypothetical protein ACTXT7_001242 [Hymenolepis weldensis]